MSQNIDHIVVYDPQMDHRKSLTIKFAVPALEIWRMLAFDVQAPKRQRAQQAV